MVTRKSETSELGDCCRDLARMAICPTLPHLKSVP